MSCLLDFPTFLYNLHEPRNRQSRAKITLSKLAQNKNELASRKAHPTFPNFLTLALAELSLCLPPLFTNKDAPYGYHMAGHPHRGVKCALFSARNWPKGPQFGFKPDAPIDVSLNLMQLGMDSLMASEISRWWRLTFGLELAVLEIMNPLSLEPLSHIVAKKLKKKLQVAVDNTDAGDQAR